MSLVDASNSNVDETELACLQSPPDTPDLEGLRGRGDCHDGAGEGTSKRSIDALTLTFLAYFLISGGPFAVEDLVGTAGMVLLSFEHTVWSKGGFAQMTPFLLM